MRYPYENKKVISYNKIGEHIYEGMIKGSGENCYTVHIDKLHPRKSTCNCPFADGRRVVCKHMIALYFTAEPQAAKDFLKQVEEWERERKEQEIQHYKDLRKYVNSLKKSELQVQLYDALVKLEEIRDRYW